MELILAALLIAIASWTYATLREHHDAHVIEDVVTTIDPLEDHPMHCKCYLHN